MKKLNICLFKHKPIYEQLVVEEAILRQDCENWCIINQGSSPAIVFGISGKVEEHVEQEETQKQGVELIKRYSGGGTVVVDEETWFVSFIMQKDDINVRQCPKELLEWTGKIYEPLFSPHPFRIRENDYAIGEKKIGGNAQYFTKERVVHHTTFLWNYTPKRMALLKMPPKMPDWRKNRPHEQFIGRLSDHFSTLDLLQEKFLAVLSSQFLLKTASLDYLDALCKQPYRLSTERLR
jgi:lipoate---protein ligase